MVVGTLCDSVVQRINLMCAGGSSMVLSKRIECLAREHVHFVNDINLEIVLGPLGQGLRWRSAVALRRPIDWTRRQFRSH